MSEPTSPGRGGYGGPVSDVIAVSGEALVDLVASADGTLAARLGGGPYNTARTIGRLGGRAVFLGRLSDDAFGGRLAAGLAESGAAPGLADRSRAPTTLAMASIDGDGAAEYRFYLAATSVPDVAYDDLVAAIPDDIAAIYAGALGLVAEPAASSLERLLLAGPLGEEPLVMIDPNCRPSAISDRAAYLARMARILARADIVKASTEDLAYLYPDRPAGEAANAILAAGPALVLVTDGPRPARAFLAAGERPGPARELAIEVPAVRVADTIGAGDAFGGAFLAWWTRNAQARAGLEDPHAVAAASRAAAQAAALTCTRPGADPPRAADLPGFFAVP
jgi:fructokinase